MRRALRAVRLAAAALAVLVAAATGAGPARAATGTVPPAAQTTAKAELARRIDSLRREIAAAKAEERRLSEEAGSAARDTGGLERALVVTGERIADIERQVVEAEARLERITEDEAFLKRDLAERRRALADVLAALQRIGRNPPPAIVAQPDDALSAVRGAMLLRNLLPYLEVEADALAADLDALSRLAADARTEWRSLERSLAALEDERADAEALLARQRAARATAEAELAAARARAARLEDEAADLAALMEGAAATRPSAGPRPDGAGGFARPVTGRLVRRFGETDGFGDAAAGQSFAALPGGTVFAPADGEVVYAGPFRSYGDLLLLGVGDRYHLLLAGMERIDVEAGEQVAAGTPVGRMGSQRSVSAVAVDLAGSGPILYVEVRERGEPVDPEAFWSSPPTRIQGVVE